MAAPTVALVLSAALIHALWNLIVVRAKDRTATTAIVFLFGAVVALPLAVLNWRVEPAGWPYVAISAALELLYFGLLVAAYQRAEMSLVYPIARGSAPVIVLVVSVLLLGVPTSIGQVLGVGLVGLGVVLVRGLRGGAHWPHVGLALAVACSIAAYVIVDKEGVRHADPLTYGTLILLIPGLFAVGYVLARGGVERVRRAFGWQAAVGGVFSIAAYVLVLIALTSAPAASVVAVRESSVVMAAILGAVVLHERGGRLRLAGSLIVALGVALVVAA